MTLFGRLRALAVLHPFPSTVNAVLVAGLYRLAGGDGGHAILLGIGMLGLQFSIGAINDVADAQNDAVTKPFKPIASGLLSRRTALLSGVTSAAVGLAIYGLFGAIPLTLAVVMLGVGLAYDLWLKRAGAGWLCFAVAFPLLPLSTWLAASGVLPPRPEVLLPVAALAGPTLQLANGLVDLERDRQAGIRAPVVLLGRGRSVLLLGALVVFVYGAAWASLVGRPGPVFSYVALAAATALALIGLCLSASIAPARRERGWQAQVIGIALLAAGWLAGVTS